MRPVILTAAAVLLAAVLAGCSTTYDLTFTNITAQQRAVEMTTPEGPVSVGVVEPDGGKLRYSLKLDNDDLPATCVVKCGNDSRQFTLTRDTRTELWIDIRPDGIFGPRDKKAKVNVKSQTEIKNVPVQQDTVVE